MYRYRIRSRSLPSGLQISPFHDAFPQVNLPAVDLPVDVGLDVRYPANGVLILSVAAATLACQKVTD